MALILVNSFIELVKFLFTIPDVKLLLSNRFCQDPVENFFGQQRQRGRVNENPTARDFVKNTQALRVINGVCGNVRGNCRGDRIKKSLSIQQDSIPLEKRKYKHK